MTAAARLAALEAAVAKMEDGEVDAHLLWNERHWLLSVARAAVHSSEAYTEHQRTGRAGWMESVWDLRRAVEGKP
jgi:hypothetical protein